MVLSTYKRHTLILTRIAICVLLFSVVAASDWQGIAAYAQTVNKDELEKQINSKNSELDSIKQQLADQQQKLLETQNQKQSLTTEVKKIDTTIKQVNLGIQASQVQIETYGLQIESLQGDISNAETDIQQKSKAVEELLRQIQQNDNENALIVFLKNKTLSDSVMEMQSLQDLNDSLIIKINELGQAKDVLTGALNQTAAAKQNKQVEYTNLQSKKEIAVDLKQQKQQFLDETKNKEKNYQDSIKQLQDRQLAIALEIEKIESQLRSQINYKDLPKSVPGLLSIPVQGSFTLTQGYGATNFARSAYAGKWHNGVDLAAPVGTPVVAASDGVVVSTDNQDRYCYRGAYGKYVAIRHYNGLTTLYGHLSLYIVSEGDKVQRGQVIGYVGRTGYATGPHLHFGVYDSQTFYTGASRVCGPKMPYGGDLDPTKYLML